MVYQLDTSAEKHLEQIQAKFSALPNPDLAPNHWSIEDSEELYRINGWGDPYFSINANGHVTVSPKGNRGGSLDLVELVQGLQPP